MRYCKKCGNRLDDFDSYCSSCGAQVENIDSRTDDKQDKRTTVEQSINNITESASENFEALICLICGILSVTFGTVVCAIVSLVFANKAREKGQDNDQTGATFCKVGEICSKISIALSVLAVVIGIIAVTVVVLI
ncbi:MAG: DUF4190 domain-containing protein [Clostridia bacterium]|nr:DUF4190 domain-containing protein [Clostridia bacterium]